MPPKGLRLAREAKSSKFKFSVARKKNVRLFEFMTKTSVLSNKYVPLKMKKIFFNEQSTHSVDRQQCSNQRSTNTGFADFYQNRLH